MSVYFFFGQEEYNIEQEIEQIKKNYLDENFSSLNLRHFSSPHYKDLSNILRTTGTMFGNIINIIDCERYFFKSGKQELINFSETELKSLEQDLNLVSENVHTIFVLKLPRDEKKSITTKEIYKILSKNTQKQEFKEYREYDNNLYNWIIKQAKSKNLTISTETAKFLVEKTGTNLRLLNSHLEKLELAIYPNKTITKELIEKNLTVTENIFKILDNLILKRKDLAVLEYKKICERRHYLEVLALLQTMISNWIEIKSDIETMTLNEIAQKQKKHEYIIKLTLQKLNNTNLIELINIKKNLIKAEEAIKIDYSLEQELEIEKALLSDF